MNERLELFRAPRTDWERVARWAIYAAFALCLLADALGWLA